MSDTFANSLMTHIMEATMIPKVQVERVVGPILSMFIGDVLTATLQHDSHLSGNIKLIAPEFPLKKENNRQSTNIDWLMFNTSRDQLLLVELKTSDTSIRGSQNSIYFSAKNAIKNKGGGFLVKDLELLRDASQESGKYQFVLENKVAPFREEISNCQDAVIIYIVPRSIEERTQRYADRVLTFSSLAKIITGPHANEWQIIHKHLTKLDNLSQRSRNRKVSTTVRSKNSSKSSRQKRWQGTFKFDEMVEFCQEHGSEIIIGFTGGKTQFASTPLSSLKNRSHYKWDYARNIAGKNAIDWISGNQIVSLFEQRNQHQNSSQINPSGSIGLTKHNTPNRKRWQGTFKFQKMVDFCQEHGDDIVIGFTGGKSQLANSDFSYLKNRSHYKWDYSKNMAGKKHADWIAGNQVLRILKRYHQYPSE